MMDYAILWGHGHMDMAVRDGNPLTSSHEVTTIYFHF